MEVKGIDSTLEIMATKSGIEIYRPSKSLTFVLTPTKTLVCVSGQTFRIAYDHRNYSKRLMQLRELIRENKMRNIVDLIEYANFKPGRRSQMYGLELVYTRLERYVNV